ncbi:hypothetical protein V5O48_003219 [Marasmius crinis-equi]|uniref:Uncharacterized protein n=1 Tax=Marasmius crinis-equi TaxID=585013 RepID=A0ABR3FTE1_9AGAR
MFSKLFVVASIIFSVSAFPTKRQEACTPNARGDTVQFASDFDGRKITIVGTQIFRLEQDGQFPSNFLLKSPTDPTQAATVVDSGLVFQSVPFAGGNENQLFDIQCNNCDVNGLSLSVATTCVVRVKDTDLCFDATDADNFKFQACNGSAFQRYSVDKRTGNE